MKKNSNWNRCPTVVDRNLWLDCCSRVVIPGAHIFPYWPPEKIATWEFSGVSEQVDFRTLIQVDRVVPDGPDNSEVYHGYPDSQWSDRKCPEYITTGLVRSKDDSLVPWYSKGTFTSVKEVWRLLLSFHLYFTLPLLLQWPERWQPHFQLRPLLPIVSSILGNIAIEQESVQTEHVTLPTHLESEKLLWSYEPIAKFCIINILATDVGLW